MFGMTGYRPGFALLVIALACFSIPRVAWGQGENVLLVVNSSSPDSLAVANHYVHLRDIPATNVVYIENVKREPKIDLESSYSRHFQSQIMTPVMEAMKQRGLDGQIDYIVYSAGFPTRFNFKKQLDTYLKQKGLKYDIHLHAPWASLTSLTYFQDNVFSSEPDFLDLDANWFANPKIQDVLSNPFFGSDAKSYETAVKSFKQKDFDKAGTLFSGLVEKNPDQAAVRYFYARTLASLGDDDKAIQQLAICKQQGWNHRSLVTQDSAFSSLKDQPEFAKLWEGMEDVPDGVRLSRGFRSQAHWSKNGWPNGSADQGRRFMLSTMLAMTEKGGSSLEQALSQISKSVEADGSHPKGTFYFAKHKDPRSRTRHSQFEGAASELRSLGYEVEISSQPVPQGNKHIVGATLGSAVINWKKSKSKFVPGAICDNFTSYGAWWTKSAQTQITEFLDAGAAGASGTVYEPYTIAAKIPDARLHVHYARGCTLAEAFYQSVNCPFQLLVLGDPLCCPFGKFPKFEVEGLTTRSVVKGDIDLNLKSIADGPEIERFEVFLDGRQFGRLEHSNQSQNLKIETGDISDGYHELRVVAISRALTATRASQKLEFWLRRDGHSIKINVAKDEVRLGEPITITASSSPSHEIEIRHNSRIVGKVKPNETLELDSSLLGQGQVYLQGFMTVGKQTVAGVKVEVKVKP